MSFALRVADTRVGWGGFFHSATVYMNEVDNGFPLSEDMCRLVASRLSSRQAATDIMALGQVLDCAQIAARCAPPPPPCACVRSS